MSPAQAGRVVTVCTWPRGDRAKLAPVRPGVDRPHAPWSGQAPPPAGECRAQRSCSVSAARRSPEEKEAPR